MIPTTMIGDTNVMTTSIRLHVEKTMITTVDNTHGNMFLCTVESGENKTTTTKSDTTKMVTQGLMQQGPGIQPPGRLNWNCKWVKYPSPGPSPPYFII